jgi:hypothetical protein
LTGLAAAIVIVAISLLFTVVTWYRDEDNVAAAVVLVAITGMEPRSLLDSLSLRSQAHSAR